MAYTYTEVMPAFENTTMQAVYNDGELTAYRIYPNEGYLLHDKSLDYEEMDFEAQMPTGKIIQGFRKYPLFVSVGYNYDFTENPYELFTMKEVENDDMV